MNHEPLTGWRRALWDLKITTLRSWLIRKRLDWLDHVAEGHRDAATRWVILKADLTEELTRDRDWHKAELDKWRKMYTDRASSVTCLALEVTRLDNECRRLRQDLRTVRRENVWLKQRLELEQQEKEV
jgi:hypothetical protein